MSKKSITKKYIIDRLRSKGFKANYKNVLCAGYIYGDLDYVILIEHGDTLKKFYDKDWR